MWLVSVVIRRYIDILIIIINFPYSTCIRSFFGSSILTSLFIFKMFFRSYSYRLLHSHCVLLKSCIIIIIFGTRIQMQLWVKLENSYYYYYYYNYQPSFVSNVGDFPTVVNFRRMSPELLLRYLNLSFVHGISIQRFVSQLTDLSSSPQTPRGVPQHWPTLCDMHTCFVHIASIDSQVPRKHNNYVYRKCQEMCLYIDGSDIQIRRSGKKGRMWCIN